MTDQAITTHEPAALTPMDLLARAITQGTDIEVLEKLMALQERYEKNQARKAFDEAMANAKAEIPVIIKNREVDFTSQKGRTNYRYEDLAGLARAIDPVLAKNGLSYRFRTSSEPNEPVTVTCIISHRLGHSEENTLSAGRDDSGNKNSIQAVGSAITYLQRYSLKAALGLAASSDDDGKSADTAFITTEQVDRLISICAEVGGNLGAFCRRLGVDGLPELPARRYGEAVALLEEKRRSTKA